MKFVALVQEYKEVMEQELLRSPDTVNSYMKDYKHFLGYLAKEEDMDPEAVTLDDIDRKVIRRYRQHMKDSGSAPRTINQRIAALKSIFKYAQEEEYIDRSPVVRIKMEEPGPTVRLIMDSRQVAEFFARIERGVFTEELKRMIFKMLLYTGLRCAECADVRLSDLSLNGDRPYLLVPRGKGNKSRAIPLNVTIVGLLKDYIANWHPGGEYLFATSTTPKISRNTIRCYMARCLARTSFAKMHYSVHTWRRTFATWLHGQGANILQIQRILGHSRPETTASYVQVPEDDLFELVGRLKGDFSIPSVEPLWPKDLFN